MFLRNVSKFNQTTLGHTSEGYTYHDQRPEIRKFKTLQTVRQNNAKRRREYFSCIFRCNFFGVLHFHFLLSLLPPQDLDAVTEARRDSRCIGLSTPGM